MLIRERTQIRAPLLERLPKLKLISQRSVYPHIDVDACTRRGVIVSSSQHADTPSYAAAELTWGLVLAAMRQIPQQMSRAQGRPVADRRRDERCAARRSASSATAGSAASSPAYGKAFGMNVLVWAREASRERARADGYAARRARQAFFEQCDVIRCTCGWSTRRAAS